MSDESSRPVGSTGPRIDGWDKVSGGALFVDDLKLPGMWFGGTVRSSVPRGTIRWLHLDPSFDWTRVVVVTAKDLPGPNVVSMIRDDHPILAGEEVRFFSEPIALVAAPDRELLARALSAVRVEIAESPPVLSIEEALSGGTIIWGTDNLLSEYRIEDGDPAAGFAKADLVVEETYRTGHQEHLYLEPNGMIAIPTDGGIEVLGSLQCPYYIHNALAKGLGLDPARIVVKQLTTGGAFGGKEDFPSVLALHVSLLAQRCRRPVKIIYDRTEDILSTTKRHPSLVRHRTGVLRDGTIVAAEIDVVLDGGAYTTLTPVVLSRSILHAAGAYRVPNVSIRGRAVATNTPPNGAFRGFGAPQSLFAVEKQMDRIARRLGIDPLDMRRKNLLRDGDRLPCGQILKDGVSASMVLEHAVALSKYEEKKRDLARSSGPIRRGIGISLFLHGGGFTGAGEERISGKAAVRFTKDRFVEILVSNVEMGQGASTVLSMIAAQALGIPLAMVRHPNPDTSQVPDTGPTVASRTTMIVGRIVIDACNDMAARLKGAIASWNGIDPERIVFEDGSASAGGPRLGSFADLAARYGTEIGPLRGEAIYAPVRDLQWDEKNYRGDAYKAYSWGADVVEVEFDSGTMEVRPIKTTAVVEIGRAIHPVLAIGQVEGGTLQALGYGYMEEVKLDRGRYMNDRMATYIIPTALDAPEFEVAIDEVPHARGPFGAKGLGELPSDGGAPALVAAIEDAASIEATEIPLTPERILDLAGRQSTAPGRKPSRPGRSPG
jgi:CO/xanthine dehydrogenase Mo-binding subunit